MPNLRLCSIKAKQDLRGNMICLFMKVCSSSETNHHSIPNTLLFLYVYSNYYYFFYLLLLLSFLLYVLSPMLLLSLLFFTPDLLFSLPLCSTYYLTGLTSFYTLLIMVPVRAEPFLELLTSGLSCIKLICRFVGIVF